jgi:hypothetical protein
MSRHIVFGTGQVGSHLITGLVHARHDVVAVNRSGGRHFAGARTVGGDATDVTFTTTLEVRPRRGPSGAAPMSWRGIVAVLDPWPHQGTAVIFGQSVSSTRSR